MAVRIKSLAQKQNDGTFSESYPFGVDGENVDLAEGVDLETKINELEEDINSKAPINHASAETIYGIAENEVYGHVQLSSDYSNISEDEAVVLTQQAAVYAYSLKAPVNHASEETIYGAADTSNYGHVKLTEDYETESEDEAVVLTQQAVFKAIEANKLTVFYVIEEDETSALLYSTLNTAYNSASVSNGLILSEKFFIIEEDETSAIESSLLNPNIGYIYITSEDSEEE